MDRTGLGDRMKRYERSSEVVLTPRMPAILRFDGKAFHTLTRSMEKPWDATFVEAMLRTTAALVDEVQGAKLAYVQSDEISVLLTDYDTIHTEGWFGYGLAKMVSVGASVCAVTFSIEMARRAYFDGRAFSVPREDVCNYFLWRQRDATRNSIQGLAQRHFSPRETHGKDVGALQDMLFKERGINWNDTPTHLKRGACVYRRPTERNGVERTEVYIDREPPIFSADREYVERWLREAYETPAVTP